MASQRSGSSSPSSGDHYNSETAGTSCWSPRTWHIDGNLGLRAEDAAPRSNAPRDSGRQKRVRTRQEARLVGPALCRLLCNLVKEPTQASPTILFRSVLRQHVVLLPASRSASNSIAPRAASASLGTASAPSFWCFRPARSYAPGHTYWNRIAATRGQVCWSCPLPVAPQLGRGADPSLNKQTCSLRATPARCTFASLELRNLLAPLRFSSRSPRHTGGTRQVLTCGLPSYSV